MHLLTSGDSQASRHFKYSSFGVAVGGAFLTSCLISSITFALVTFSSLGSWWWGVPTSRTIPVGVALSRPGQERIVHLQTVPPGIGRCFMYVYPWKHSFPLLWIVLRNSAWPRFSLVGSSFLVVCLEKNRKNTVLLSVSQMAAYSKTFLLIYSK